MIEVKPKEIEFEVTSRNHYCTMTAIDTHTKDRDHSMSLYLDNETGDVLYPVIIVSEVLSVSISLDSDVLSSCSVPPSIPGSMVDNIVTYLNTFHEVVAAARRLIKEEQQKIRNARTD